MKRLVLALSLVTIYSSYAQEIQMQYTQSDSNLALNPKNIHFNYFVQYLGPSLSNQYQDGATYNRFKSGQDYKGDDTDTVGSYQIYHALKLSYNFTNHVVLGVGYTFQDDVNSGIQYDVYNKDGSLYQTQERSTGLSYNNQQISLFVGNIINNNYFYLSNTFVYEIPTTQGSQDAKMIGGVALQPTIGIYTSNPKVYLGINASVQRDFYKDRETRSMCGNSECQYPNTQQTLKASLSPYLNYQLTNSLQLTSRLDFDWDQKGNQVGTSKFNKNMDDIAEVGLSYSANSFVNLSSKLQFALDQKGTEKTATLFSMGISI